MSSPGDADLEASVVRGPAPVVHEEWLALALRAGRTPYELFPGWQEAWWRHRGETARRMTIVVRRHGQLRALLPLAIERAGIARVAGVDWATFDGVLVERGDQAAVRAAIDVLPATGARAMIWHGLRADAAVLEGVPRHIGLVQRAAAPLLTLDDAWETTFARLMSKRTRDKLVSKWRAFERLGDVSTRVLREPAELLAALGDIASIHHARWDTLARERGIHDRSLFASPSGMAFLRDGLSELAADGVERLLLLELDGRPVAFRQYAVVGDTLYGQRVGFHPDYHRFSPGLLVLVRSFEAAIGEGVRLANLGHGTDDYKRSLVDHEVGVARGILALRRAGRPMATGMTAIYRVRGAVRESTIPRRVRAVRAHARGLGKRAR